jgi:CRP-like cAMP-binding protein
VPAPTLKHDAVSGEQLQDIATLARNPLLAALSLDEIGSLLARLEVVSFGAGWSAAGERGLCFVMNGELELRELGKEPRRLVAGDFFGEASLWGERSTAGVLAGREVRLARLSPAAYAELAASQPKTALQHAAGTARIRQDRPRARGAADPRLGSRASRSRRDEQRA